MSIWKALLGPAIWFVSVLVGGQLLTWLDSRRLNPVDHAVAYIGAWLPSDQMFWIGFTPGLILGMSVGASAIAAFAYMRGWKPHFWPFGSRLMTISDAGRSLYNRANKDGREVIKRFSNSMTDRGVAYDIEDYGKQYMLTMAENGTICMYGRLGDDLALDLIPQSELESLWVHDGDTLRPLSGHNDSYVDVQVERRAINLALAEVEAFRAELNRS